MIIKKYQGKTKEEAWQNAKKELGEGLVEMNVKMVKPKGMFSFLKSSVVELTVAKEEETREYAAMGREQVETRQKDGVTMTLGQGKIIPMKQPAKMAAGQEMMQTQPAFKITPEKKEADRKEPEKKEMPSQGSILEEKIDNLQNLLVKQLANQNPMEEEMQKAAAKDTKRVNFLRILYNKMIDNEMDEKYANEIIDEIEKNCKEDATMDIMLSEIYQRMILKMGKPFYLTQAASGPKVVYFVGPTGVGKTTTIAKIASTFRIEQKKKIALLTADTYRIAAAEQLRTYANILQVPFRVVYTQSEIISAIEDFKGYDFIFVDTTGHSPNNESQRESTNDLIRALPEEIEKEVFLVMSASTKYKDLCRTADRYKEIADYKLIFTKLDETASLGNLYNIRMYTGAPLSYVTCGQNVPDDIEYFNPQTTVKQLLGGKR